MIIVKVGGESQKLLIGSLNIETAVEERSTATFLLADLDGSKSFVKGQPVEIHVPELLDDDDFKDGMYHEVEVGETGEYFLQPQFVIGGTQRFGMLFSGVVDSATRKKVGKDAFIHSLECVDWHYAADKRLAAQAYENEMSRDIVIDLWEDYLEEEDIEIASTLSVTFENVGNTANATAHGLTNDTPVRLYTDDTLPAELSTNQWYYVINTAADTFQLAETVGGSAVAFTDNGTGNHLVRYDFSVDTGIELEEAVFNYVPLSQCFDALADETGMWWMIDEYKRLHFVERAHYSAPWTLTGTDIRRGTFHLEHSASKYRNKQIIRGPRDETDEQIETRLGDGENQAFTMSYPIARVPTISVMSGSTSYTDSTSVGIKGLEMDKEWYWSKGDPVIAQQSTDTPLTSTESVRVTYTGEFPIVVISQDPASIIARAAVEEAGTGIVEHVKDEPQRTTRESAFQLAAKLLEKYHVIGRTARFRTRRHGLRPGHMQPVSIADYDLTSELLIESVSISDQGGRIIWYDVTGLEGPEIGSWAKVFGEIVRMGAGTVREGIGEGEVIIIPVSFTKNWNSTEAPANIFQEFYPSTDPLYDANFGLSFEPSERVEFLTWYETTAVELGRKAITQQTGATEGSTSMFTLTYLQPYEAISTGIAYMGWYGGIEASTTAGSGVLVDFRAHPSGVTAKTFLAAWQVEKTDNKW